MTSLSKHFNICFKLNCTVAVMSLVQIPINKFVGTNATVVVDGERLYEQGQKLFALLSREIIVSPPCDRFEKGQIIGYLHSKQTIKKQRTFVKS